MQITLIKIENKIRDDAWIRDDKILWLLNIWLISWKMVAFGDLTTKQIATIQLQEIDYQHTRQVMIVNSNIHQIK